MLHMKESAVNVHCLENRKIVTQRLICALVACGVLSQLAHAQNNAPKTFYKKDYAIAPGAEGRDDAPSTKDASHRKVGNSSGQQGAPQGSQRATTSVAKKRMVVISVYVNSVDKEHLAKVLEEVYALHDEKTAFITSLNHIGDYRTITPEIESDLSKRKIRLFAAIEPPYTAQATVSPTWIIETKKGFHIAEGVIPIHAFFDEFGEYDPKRRSESNRTSSLEGF